ncbi:outer membrane protein assembly factor BamD [Methylomarinovum caldicuralii]|uniref:Outer membrane protein assembly factor BamD n=1 Tax=Methylomarinovum caldicuralii TaxID=438856 RepID=A0AAU9CM96_9GAMM|nr:outer membrane protein assembly factor BamD [Methylomarinovum caldicuralii]BCX82801.1 outer membrane protein assembly factor BamD [Methylomarinovum caldicuralii]
MRTIAVLLSLSLLLGGCSTVDKWFKSGPKAVEVMPEEDLYKKAKEKLDRGAYTRAIELYQALETRFPFGRYGPKVLLDLAWAYYKQGDAEAGLAVLERFFKRYPTHARLDYAWYLRGLIHMSQGLGFVERYFPIDLTKRDVSPLADAYQDFVTVVERFPDSEYADKARQRLTGVLTLIATHEYHVADYYFRRGAYLAAANRAAHIVRNYPRTRVVPHALRLMAEAYHRLELEDLAAQAEKTYALNYGQSEPPPLRHGPRTLLGWMFWLFRWD